MPEPIRVLHVITRMVKGGAQENTLANVARIHGDGWESSLVTGHAGGAEGSLEPECLAAGVRMIRVPDLVRELSPRQDFRALQELKRVIRKERPHLVHTHTSKAGILGRMAAKSCGVPVVVHTPHGHVFHSYESGVKTRFFIRAERWCAPRADYLVALTENERREHLELGIGKPDQWSVVHSGIDFAPFLRAAPERPAVRAELGIPETDPVIGTVGRLVPIKGQQYLLEAYAALRREHPRLHLVLVGDGELRGELVGQARALGVPVHDHEAARPEAPAPGVHFTGLRRDVPRLLAALDLFALPSLNEGMGRVLVEAMAMELACVASRVSGTPDVVTEGETGLLVPPRDPEALRHALAALLSDPERAREMGRRGRERALAGFSVERMTHLLENLYREALARKGIAPPPPRKLEWPAMGR
jgi:glycosyltransferase involved in cell wall biosynthesis